MLFAAERMLATKGARSTCPGCLKAVIAKCGDVVRHHWAHEANEECDPFAEPGQDASAWHRYWQDCVPEYLRERYIGPHRADIVTASPNRKVVELQHSNLSPGEIREREQFYRYPQDAHGMWWVFDAKSAYANDRLELGGKTIVQFTWKRPRVSIIACQRPVFLDIGVALLNVLNINMDVLPCVGVAQVFSHATLLRRIVDETMTARPRGEFDDSLSCNARALRINRDADRDLEWIHPKDMPGNR